MTSNHREMLIIITVQRTEERKKSDHRYEIGNALCNSASRISSGHKNPRRLSNKLSDKEVSHHIGFRRTPP